VHRVISQCMKLTPAAESISRS